MSKLLTAALVLVASVRIAAADVVEPTPEPTVQAESAEETPPLDGATVVGETLIGGLFTVGGGFGGAYLGYKLELRGGCHSEFCGLGGIVLGGLAGITFATPVGVYIAGSSGDETGSLGTTILGSVLGTLGGIAITAGSEGKAAPVLLVAPLVGSLIGFNATRTYKVSHGKSGRVVVPVASATGSAATFGLAGAF